MKKFIYFSAPWCGPCRTLGPIINEVTNTGITVQKINIDDEPVLAKQYSIRNVPTVVLVDEVGKEVTRTVGVNSKSHYIDLFNQN